MPHPETGPSSSKRAGDQGSEASEEERLRKEIGRSEGQFRLLVQEVEEYAIFRMDPDGYIQSWNQGAERIKGYTEEEILGKHFSLFYTEEDRKAGRPETGLKSAEEEGQWTEEGWRTRKDGSRFWARVTITALYDEANAEEANAEEANGEEANGEEDRELRGFAKVTRDLTDRKRREEELAEQKQKAERKNALLRLMQRVASAANDAESFEEALQEAVDATSEQTGWPLGHVFRRAGEEKLEASGIGNRGSEKRFDTFKETTEKLSFDRGEGLPGQVLESGEPAWIEDVTEDPSFPQATAAAEAGIKGAFAFPVSLEGETKAVLEFFSEEPEPPDSGLLEAMESVGMQLSRVAERVEAKRELEASEERFRRLFEDAQEGIAISTTEGRIEAANDAAAEIFGYSQEELRSMETRELYVESKEQKEAAKELEEKGFLKGKELRLRRKDGEEIICQFSTSVHHAEKGKPVSFQTFFRDVTERREAEKALRESEEMFRKLAENALIGIGMTQDGTYVYANPTLAEITGYSREELLGMPFQKLVPSKDWPKTQARIEKTLEGEGIETPTEMRILAKSGETRLVEVAGSLIDYQGKPAVIGTMQDITERRRLQREVLSVQEEERRRLGQELHDGVASQLTGATLKLNLLSRKTEEEVTDAVQKVQEIINESAEDVRRLSRGLNPGGLSEGNLPSALKQLATNFEEGRFENILEENLEDEGPLQGEGEEEETGLFSLGEALLEEDEATHLYRIAQEAVNNARKYAEASEIIVRLREGEDTLVLEVEDDGVGFDPSEVSKEGLGLRSMRHRAELLGATLTVESAPGEGTLLRCSLPV